MCVCVPKKMVNSLIYKDRFSKSQYLLICFLDFNISTKELPRIKTLLIIRVDWRKLMKWETLLLNNQTRQNCAKTVSSKSRAPVASSLLKEIYLRTVSVIRPQRIQRNRTVTPWVKYCRNDPRELLSQRGFVYIPIVNKRAELPLSKHPLE